MNRVFAAFAIAGTCLVSSGCGPKPGASDARGVSPSDAVFYVKSNVATASVYVDGRYIGPVAMVKGGLAVVAGKHRLEVRHEDYFSRYLELDLKRAERRRLEVTLAPILP